MGFKCLCALQPLWCCTKHKMDASIQILEPFFPKRIYCMAPFEFAKESWNSKELEGLSAKSHHLILLEGSNCRTNITMVFNRVFYPKFIYGMLNLRYRCPCHLKQI